MSAYLERCHTNVFLLWVVVQYSFLKCMPCNTFSNLTCLLLLAFRSLGGKLTWIVSGKRKKRDIKITPGILILHSWSGSMAGGKGARASGDACLYYICVVLKCRNLFFFRLLRYSQQLTNNSYLSGAKNWIKPLKVFCETIVKKYTGNSHVFQKEVNVRLRLFLIYSTYHLLKLNFVWVIWCKIILPMLLLVTENRCSSINHFTDCLAQHTQYNFLLFMSYHITSDICRWSVTRLCFSCFII